jgi:hypothetical protein
LCRPAGRDVGEAGGGACAGASGAHSMAMGVVTHAAVLAGAR